MSKKQTFYNILLINLIYFFFFYFFFGARFLTNDDAGMSMAASGFLTGKPIPFLLYTNVLIGYILNFLYKIIPSIPWYTLNLVFTLYLSTSLFYYMLTDKLSDLKYSTLIYTLFFALSAIVPLYFLQFTIVSTLTIIIGFTGIFYELFIKSKSQKIAVVISAFVVILGSLIRYQSFILSFAIVSAAILLYILFYYKTLNIAQLKSKLLFIIAIIVSIFILRWTDNFIYNHTDGWRTFKTKNKIKSKIVDFNILDYNPDLKNSILKENNLTQSDYRLFKLIFFIDPKIYKLTNKSQDLIINQNFKNYLKSVKKTFKHRKKIAYKNIFNKSIFSKALLFTILLTLVFVKPGLKNYIYLILFFLTINFLLLSISILFKPVPIRVFYPAFISFFIISLTVTPLNKFNFYLLTVISFYIIILTTQNYSNTIKYYNQKKKSYNKILNNLSDKKLYIFWRSPRLEYINPFKSYNKFDKHIILVGSFSLSDFFLNYYSQKYSLNSALDLVDNDNIILVIKHNRTNDLNYLKRFYSYHYHIKVKFQRVIRNGFFYGYKIKSINK